MRLNIATIRRFSVAAFALACTMACPAFGQPPQGGFGGFGGIGGLGGGFGSQTALPKPHVSIKESGNKRVIVSNGLPDHATGQFPNRGNPNRISAQNHRFDVPLKPRNTRRLTSSRGASFGVALNGVPFDPFAAEFWRRDRRSGWSYEPLGPGINLGTDQSNAHVQPGGVYHYHGLPKAYVEKLINSSPDKAKMVQIGWAADGFPIYNNFGLKDSNDLEGGFREMKSSYVLKRGVRPSGPRGRYDGTFVEDWEYDQEAGDLDEANGRFSPTPDFPDGIFHYYVTTEFPFIPRYWRGEADQSFRKGPPGGGPGGGRGPGPPGRRPPPFGGPPPRGGGGFGGFGGAGGQQ
ncbi:YHYH protein [Stratiformator vulcanicus]|uniref:YHYH domain-containing protein n=1 Tax=Stratiformator vulcanicus TaxID=2527980 RepID=A0A517R1R3_9PLAN|nr:YHYH protein [Stratiformator vulcanicus]QDT37812.1 hypothetical protein Pan189_21940 [Stratiformator vulcanicus]